jgi:aspartate/methionine/tyrosine aminotransferase
MKLAQRMSRLGTETAFEILAAARALEAQGREIVHMEIGEPDFTTPANIIGAACKSLQAGHTHYTPSPGIPELRQAIAEEVSKTRGMPVDPAQVVVTPGAKPIMFYTIMALAEPGDEVIYPNPGFPIYESMINFVGATAVPLQLREDRGFGIDLQELRSKVSKRTTLIIINSPQNPSGGVLTREELKEIAEIAAKHDIPVLSDEIYSRMVYDGEFASITAFPGMSVSERTIILDGFSKTYAMTGWRLGYGVMPKDLAAHISRLMTNSNSCTSACTQYAGLEALKGPQDESYRMIAEFKKRRDVIVAGLNKIPGIRCHNPQGAFYVFPNITGTGMKSKEMEQFLLHQAGVATLSGTSFGKYGEGFIRLSYANSIANINKALDWIADALAKR